MSSIEAIVEAAYIKGQDNISEKLVHLVRDEMGTTKLAKRLLKQLTDEERMDIFKEYCLCCGSIDTSCSCWNDD